MLTFDSLDKKVRKDCKKYCCILEVKKILSTDENDNIKMEMIEECVLRKKEKEKIRSQKNKEQHKVDMDECKLYLNQLCSIFGLNAPDEDVDFHHIDQNIKKFPIASKANWIRINNLVMTNELDKCVLLHPTIHEMIHSELDEIKDLMEIYPNKFLPSEIYYKHWELFINRYRNKTEEEINQLCDYLIEDKYPFIKDLLIE